MAETAEQLAPENRGETGANTPPEGRRFRPGESGNRGGRPKGLARKARELAGEDGSTALMFLASVMADKDEATKERILAARLLLERGWGKPPAFAPIEADDPLDFS